MSPTIYGLSIDLICAECDKFMGLLVKEIPVLDFDKEGRKIGDYLNSEQIMPICDICSATKGYMQPGTLRRLDK